ncbi:L-lactate MFS transporter [Dethiobacter alkaliphilus]|uniref:Major facilitator superfamily MFS_1 n=1 Tax=Dethiobacter alkaliphilus AHT 1 TaxID=555088 RepID=C0GCC3_DETAL|nr:OFA family MFS transporter [Dethiobacter alkaliphilus]EEG78858.1 major facilitator superfamily MFS_1 [Dethiobacter alkaliphilus AHT 1]
MSEQKLMNRWLVVVGTLLIIPCIGAVYAWSIYRQPLAEILAAYQGVSPDSLTIPLNFVFSLVILFFAFGAIPGGLIQDKIGPKKVTIAGGAMLGLGLILSSFATSVMHLYIFYGVLGGIGIGFAYITPLATCNKWFPDKRGTISGVAVAGMGLGTIVFSPIGQMLIESIGPLIAMRVLGVAYFVLVAIGAQWMVLPPEGYRPKGWEPTGTQKNVIHFNQKEMVSTLAFYKIWISFMVGTASGLMMIGIASPVGQQIAGLTVTEAAAIVGMLGLFNGGGRIFWGAASDKLGRTRTIAIYSLITAVVMLTFGFINSSITFAIALFTIAACFGGFMAVFPSLTADFYGTRDYGGNYGIIYLAYGFGAPLGGWIGSAFPLNQAFNIAAFCAFISFLLMLNTKRPEKKAVLTSTADTVPKL